MANLVFWAVLLCCWSATNRNRNTNKLPSIQNASRRWNQAQSSLQRRWKKSCGSCIGSALKAYNPFDRSELECIWRLSPLINPPRRLIYKTSSIKVKMNSMLKSASSDIRTKRECLKCASSITFQAMKMKEWETRKPIKRIRRRSRGRQ